MAPVSVTEPDEWVTIKDAAARLGLHYMTVYRYVRLGRLPAEREGSEWRVRMSDAEQLVEQSARAPRGRRGSPHPATHRDRLYGRLVEGDEAGAWAVCEAALASGMEPAAIYLELISPNLSEVGRRWAAGELDVADEHRATAVVHRLIGRLGPRFNRPGLRVGAVVIGGAPGDRHHLPLAMLADLLRGAGYRVVDLGADIPSDSFARALTAADDIVAAGVSVCAAECLPGASATLAALRAARPDLPLLVGGAAVPDEETAWAMGADGFAVDGLSAVRLIDELVGRTRHR